MARRKVDVETLVGALHQSTTENWLLRQKLSAGADAIRVLLASAAPRAPWPPRERNRMTAADPIGSRTVRQNEQGRGTDRDGTPLGTWAPAASRRASERDAWCSSLHQP